ncbi:MAG: hypothetical protein II630_01635 [Bacteroidales bacterium]|nr:hypothetical protein [Bacteroidales bacterium]
MNIHIDVFNSASVDVAIKQLQDYQKRLEEKTEEVVKRLAEIGATRAQADFSNAQYDGNKDFQITVEKSDNGYVVRASGESVLFVEFGTGVTYGYGHPKADEFGMGPGTYPNGKGHWDDPNGWYLPKSAGGGHTMGNAPALPMYNAEQEIKANIERIVKEVFSSD